MKFRMQIAVGVILTALIASDVAAAADAELRTNVWPRRGHTLVKDVLFPWIEKIEFETDGRVQFERTVAPLAGGKGLYDAVAGGVVHVSFSIQGYTPARFPYSGVAEFPFTGNTATAVSIAFWRTYEKFFEGRVNHRGVKLLGLFSHGPGHIWTRDKPIRSIDDIQNVKMRTGGGFQRTIARILDTVVVAAEAPKNYEILSRGTADGTFVPIEGVYSFKLNSLLNYRTRFDGGLYNTGFMVIMDKDKWNGLSPRDQEIIVRLSGENIARLAGNAWDEDDDAGRAQLESDGITTIVADKEFETAVQDRIEPHIDAWVRLMEKKYGIDGRAALAFMRSEAAKIDAAIAAGIEFEPWD